MKNLIISISLVFILSFIISLNNNISNNFSAYAQSKEQCSEQLNKAEEHYQAGKWTEAIELIEQCLKKQNVSEVEKGRAYRILGLVYIAIQLEKEANDAVKNLLIMVPNYKIDPDKDPPSLQKIIDNMAQTLTPKITGVNPGSVKEGDDPFTLSVTGANFVYGSVVKFNGTSKATTYVSATELKTEITSEDISKAGDYQINVYSPITGGKTSNTEVFKVETSSSFPWTWIAVGGGAVAAAVVAIIALGGDNKEETPPATTLANPPARP